MESGDIVDSALMNLLEKHSLRVVVEGKPKEEGARGNNPVRIADAQGYNLMLWSHWTRQLGLEPTMKGWLVFIPQTKSHGREGV